MRKKSKVPANSAASASVPKAERTPKQKLFFLKFLLAFVVCMGLFYIFYYSGFYNSSIEVPLMNAQARMGNFLLNLVGQGTTVHGCTITGGKFSIDIKKGCDGLEAMAILASGILIFPASFKLKMPGLALGIGVLFILNLVRIAGLYIIGKNCSNEIFEAMHFQGGFIIFTAIGVLLLLSWMNWASTKLSAEAVQARAGR
jgi:exosortase/archaeosortase family protein